jgi:L-threonylcarbamoyladenylate synthase
MISIEEACEILKKGNILAIPTETVYGLAANAYDDSAILKVFERKGRPAWNPLIVHTGDLEQLTELTTNVPIGARDLIKAFWPGSLTLVLPKSDKVSTFVTAGKDSVAIRMPNHPMTLSLLRALSFPLVAPSANPFQRISPTSAMQVSRYFGDELPILDGGPCAVGVESTIVSFVQGAPEILRLGSVTQQMIESVIGKVDVRTYAVGNPDAPGMIRSHYAPRTPAFLLEDMESVIPKLKPYKIGIVRYAQPIHEEEISQQLVLSPKGDIEEAARNLFQMLAEMDEASLDLIFIEPFPDVGIGSAANDRLFRATLPMEELRRFMP